MLVASAVIYVWGDDGKEEEEEERGEAQVGRHHDGHALGYAAHGRNLPQEEEDRRGLLRSGAHGRVGFCRCLDDGVGDPLIAACVSVQVC